MKNIIINNRIVSNATFATRFVNFLKEIEVSDPMSDEELDYMRRVANSLLELQINTSTETEEIEYLKRCHKSIVFPEKSNEFVKLKKGDWIIITNEKETKSKYFKLGSKFKVVSSFVRPKFKNRNRFENHITLKYGVNYEYDYNNFQLFLNDCKEFGEPVVQEVVVSLPNNTKYAIRSDLYGYKVLLNGI